jgi:hypothetical protein
MASLPRYYAEVNQNKPKEYSDYENYENNWGILSFILILLLFINTHF